MNNYTVIIPSKTASNLIPCIEAVWKNEPQDTPIIVVDDGLTPDAAQRGIFHKWDKERRIVWVLGKKPFCFSVNVNIGINKAGNSDVILLNDDALLTSKLGFTLLQKEAEKYQQYGCIGAVTNVTGQIHQKPRGLGLRHVHHIAFVCVLIPRRTIDQIGLLDERYCIDYGVEDRDYCEMINRAGLLVGVHDSCFVDHSKLTSSFRGHPMAPGRSAQNRALFLDKFNLTNYFKFR